jgi:hypothetical protein
LERRVSLLSISDRVRAGLQGEGNSYVARGILSALGWKNALQNKLTVLGVVLEGQLLTRDAERLVTLLREMQREEPARVETPDVVRV